MEIITLLNNMGSTAQLNPTTIAQLSQEAESSVQKLLIFFRPNSDHRRVVQLCCNLSLTTGATKTRLVAIPFQSTPDQQASWQRLLGRFLPFLVQHLGTYSNWYSQQSSRRTAKGKAAPWRHDSIYLTLRFISSLSTRSEQEAESVFALFDTLTLPETYLSTQDTQAVSLSKHFSQTLSSAGILPQLAQFLSRIVSCRFCFCKKLSVPENVFIWASSNHQEPSLATAHRRQEQTILWQGTAVDCAYLASQRAGTRAHGDCEPICEPYFDCTTSPQQDANRDSINIHLQTSSGHYLASLIRNVSRCHY